MNYLCEPFASRVEAAVQSIEGQTDAELVVVAARRSGHYRDVAWLASALVAFGVLCFLVYAPVPFSSALLPLDVLLVGGLGGWWVNRSHSLLYRLVPASRRHAQVEVAARNAYLEEAVHGTRRHTGILVYVSDMEREVYLLPDPALEGRIPGSAWTRLDLRPGSLDALLATLEALGQVLAAHVPPVQGDNPNEIPDAPRVRP